MVKSVLATLTISIAASVAAADTQVWFSTPNVNGNGPGDPGGAPGQDLDLFCQTGVGICEWQISIMATQTGGWWGGYATDLFTLEPDNPKDLSGSNVQIGATNPFDDVLSPGLAGPGPNILIGAGGGTFNPGGFGPGTFELVTFTLSKPEDLDPGSVGTIVAQDGDFPPWINNLSPFGAEEPHEYTRIVVTNVPEPGSYTFVGICAVCAIVCLRRCRKARSGVSATIKLHL